MMGAILHGACQGTGIVDYGNDTVEVCVECMGSGVVGMEFNEDMED